MKKALLTAVVLLLGLVVLFGCTPKEQQEAPKVGDICASYAKINEATQISQHISISDNGVEKYSLDKTVQKVDDNYRVTVKEKRLNKIDLDNIPDEAYTETTSTETFAEAQQPDVGVKFDGAYFEASTLKIVKAVEGGVETLTVEGAVNDSDVAAFLDMQSELPDGADQLITGLKVKAVAVGDKFASLEMSYTSKGLTVQITLTFAY